MKRKYVVLALAAGTSVVMAVCIAYVAGYWPQRQARVTAETVLRTTRADLDRAEALNRLYGLQSRLVDLRVAVEARNFGDAQVQATAFFDSARAEARRPDQGGARSALEGIIAGRDALTAALTRNDAAALDILRDAMTQVRAALGNAARHDKAATGLTPPTEPRL